jgi:Phage tail assembly chaperone protein, TAC
MEAALCPAPFASSPVETACRAERRLDDARRERKERASLLSDAATLLCGQCAVVLGWRPHEFWDATPAELACVLRALMPQSDDPADSSLVARMMELFPDG